MALIIAVVTVATGRVALHALNRYKTWWQISDAFADGIFLGIAFFHLLPHAFHTLIPHWHLAPATAWIAIKLIALTVLGFALLGWVTRLEHHHGAWFLLIILSLHAFIMGSVLGIAGQLAELLLIFVAILTHKGFEAFALITGLKRYWKSGTALYLVLYIFALMTPLGIILGSLLKHHLLIHAQPHFISYLNAFAAGAFIFIASSHTHAHSHVHDVLKRYQQLMVTIGGLGLMAVLSLWV